MLTRSLIVTAALLGSVAIPLSGVQAKSNNSHSGNSATNHQASSGSSTAQAKQKKKTKPAISDITVTKTKDKASPQ